MILLHPSPLLRTQRFSTSAIDDHQLTLFETSGLLVKMDIAYDQIQEEALSPKDQEEREKQQGGSSLNTEFQEAFKAVSSSPWGAKLGGFFGQVKKQVSVSRQRSEIPRH